MIPTFDFPRFFADLRLWRLRHHLTLTQLAPRLHLSSSTLSRLETLQTCHTLRATTLIAALHICGMDLSDYLINPSPPTGDPPP